LACEQVEEIQLDYLAMPMASVGRFTMEADMSLGLLFAITVITLSILVDTGE